MTNTREIFCYRWTDGGGYNADYRYSFVDPRLDEDEVYDSGASCVGKCEPLYTTPLAETDKVVAYFAGEDVYSSLNYAIAFGKGNEINSLFL
jgi:hypothetical protein